MHKAVKILILSNIFFNFSVSFLSPVWAIFVQGLGGSILQATIAWGAYNLFAGIFMFLLGRSEDSFNKRILFVFGNFLNLLGISGYFFVTGFYQLLVVQAFLGTAFAIMNPSFNTIFSKSLTKGREDSEWGYYGGAINFVIVITSITTGIIITTLGFHTLFMIMLLTAILSLAASSLFLKKEIKKQIRAIAGKNYSV